MLLSPSPSLAETWAPGLCSLALLSPSSIANSPIPTSYRDPSSRSPLFPRRIRSRRAPLSRRGHWSHGIIALASRTLDARRDAAALLPHLLLCRLGRGQRGRLSPAQCRWIQLSQTLPRGACIKIPFDHIYCAYCARRTVSSHIHSDGHAMSQEKRYRSMQEHIRRAHPAYYISKLPATEESFSLMINSPPSDRPRESTGSGIAPVGKCCPPVCVRAARTFPTWRARNDTDGHREPTDMTGMRRMTNRARPPPRATSTTIRGAVGPAPARRCCRRRPAPRPRWRSCIRTSWRRIGIRSR